MLLRFFAVVLLISGLSLSACGGDQAAMASGKGAGGKKGAAGDAGRGPESLPVREVRVARAETASLARTVAVSGFGWRSSNSARLRR